MFFPAGARPRRPSALGPSSAISSTDPTSTFLAGVLDFQSVSGGGFSDSGFALGGTFGYRILAGTRVGGRFEGGYRRWFDSKLNEFTFGMGIGGIVRRTQ